MNVADSDHLRRAYSSRDRGSTGVCADKYPTKPIRLIVAFPPVDRPTSSRGSWDSGSPSGSGSRSSSTTAAAPGAPSAPRSRRERTRTVIR